MLSLSSKGALVRRNAWDATVSAFLAVCRDPGNDITPARVVECFRAYLSWFYGPGRKEEEKQQRFELFPKNFIERPSGLLHWDAKLKGGYVPAAAAAPSPASPQGGQQPVAPARSPEDSIRLKRMSDGSWWYGEKGCKLPDLLSLGPSSGKMSPQEALEAAAKALEWYEDAQAPKRASDGVTAPQRPNPGAPRLPSLMELGPDARGTKGAVA